MIKQEKFLRQLYPLMPHHPPSPAVLTQCSTHRDHAQVLEQHLRTAQCSGALPLCYVRIPIKLHTQLGQCLVSLSCKPEKGYCALNIPGILQKSTLFICPSSQVAFQAKAQDSSDGADHLSPGKDTHQHSLMLRLLSPRCTFPLTHLLVSRPLLATLAITLCRFSVLPEVPAGTCSPG